MNAANIDQPQVDLSPMVQIEPYLQSMANARDPDAYRVVLLGDSTLAGPDGRIPHRLDQTLPDGSFSRTVDVLPLVQPGFNAFDFYFLADMIVDTDPDQVVLPLNLQTLPVTRTDRNARSRLAGWIEADRLWEAVWLPFQPIGLTVDRLLFYKMIVACGGSTSWSFLAHEQARVGAAWKRLGTWAAARWPRSPMTAFRDASRRASTATRLVERRPTKDGTWRTTTVYRGARFSHAGALGALGTALRGIDESHAVLEVLGATLRRFRRANIDTLVYVIPINVDHLDVLGFDTSSGLARTIESIRLAVESNGGKLVDLHRLLRDDSFRDPAHFTSPGLDAVVRALATRALDQSAAGANATR